MFSFVSANYMASRCGSAASQVTRADYERADTILKCSDRVYSPLLSIPNG
ncbi:MAG: hypothetical protein ACLR6J_05545 [Parabacteroides merdae]